MMGGMDWTRIVRDLKESPLTQAQIAAAIGVTQPTISDIERGEHGGRLSYTAGARLIELWREKCASNDRDDPPELINAPGAPAVPAKSGR